MYGTHLGFSSILFLLLLCWQQKKVKRKIENARIWRYNIPFRKCFRFQWPRINIQHWLWLFTSCIIHCVISFYRCVLLFCLCPLNHNKYANKSTKARNRPLFHAILKYSQVKSGYFFFWCSISICLIRSAFIWYKNIGKQWNS